jgi:hypothetical protein
MKKAKPKDDEMRSEYKDEMGRSRAKSGTDIGFPYR